MRGAPEKRAPIHHWGLTTYGESLLMSAERETDTPPNDIPRSAELSLSIPRSLDVWYRRAGTAISRRLGHVSEEGVADARSP